MKNLIKYVITLLIGLVIALLIANAKGIFNTKETKEMYHILSDSFFVPGVMITGIGLLVFVSNEGTFDGLSYGMIAFFNLFKNKCDRKYNSFYEYKQMKQREKTSIGFLLISGLILIGIAVLFVILM